MSDLKALGQSKDNSIKFTDDQAKAIDGIIEFIAEPYNDKAHVIGLTGAGGTGNTFIINYILLNCKYSNSVIKCTSSTHKACRVFSQALNGRLVDTIQSTFGLRLDLRLEDFNPKNPLYGLYLFKRGYGGKVVELIGEFDLVISKFWYFVYNVSFKLYHGIKNIKNNK